MTTLHKLLLLALASLLLVACRDITNLERPEKISVKTTDASYSVSLGSSSFLISDHFNATTLQQTVTEKTNSADDEEESTDANDAVTKVAVYDYWPGGANSGSALQQFLFHYPLATIPLDFGEYLNKLDLLSRLSKEISKEFDIPALDGLRFGQPLSLPDFNALVISKFTLGSLPAISIPEAPGATLSIADKLPAATLDITVTAPDFSTMDFASGALIVRFDRTDSSAMADDFACNVGVELQTRSGSVIAQSDGQTSLHISPSSSAQLALPLDGKSLVPNMRLKLVGSYGNGRLGAVHTYRISIRLADGTQIAKITGLTMSTSDLGANGVVAIPEQEIPLGDVGSYLIEATIAEGSLDCSAALPDGWTGVSCTPSLAISGGLQVANSEFVDVTTKDGKSYLLNKHVDLWPKTLLPTHGVVLSGSLALSLKKATLVLQNDSNTLDLVGAISISKVGASVIDIHKLLGEDALAPEPASASLGTVGNYVQSVIFNEIGIKADVFCDLPTTGMSFTPAVTSELFNITSAAPLTDTLAITPGKAGVLNMTTPASWAPYTLNPIAGVDEDGEAIVKDADFAISVQFKGTYDAAHPSYIGLTELEFGRSYSFTVNMELVYNWEKIILNTDGSDSLKFSGTKETGLDLQKILESHIQGEQKDLLDNIRFTDRLTAYLSVTRPPFTATADVSEDPLKLFPNFAGEVSAYTYSRVEGEEDPVRNETPKPLVTNSDAIKLINSWGDVAKLANSNLLITKPLFRTENDYSFKLSGIMEIINDHPAGLDFDYSVGLGGSTPDGTLLLTKAQVQALASDLCSTSIDIAIDIVLPLEFYIINDGINIENVLALAGKSFEGDDDLLKRDSADSDVADNFNKYGEMVRQISLAYNLFNNTGLGMSASAVLIKTLVVQDDGTRSYQPSLTKEILVDSNDHVFYLSPDEITQVLQCFPFQPVISVSIAPATIQIPRNAQFGVKAKLTLTFDGEVVVYGDEED